MNNPGIIDHTLLKPDATESDIARLCDEAEELAMGAVCVNPKWVEFCARRLSKTNVKVCTVVGFPLGACTTDVKVFETEKAVAAGATEIDMVIDIGAVKEGDWETVRREIEAVKAAAGKNTVKVILEVCLLDEKQIIAASRAAVKAGADFVKTSTGFSSGGATVEAVKLMRKTVGENFGVKAAGGIRNAADYRAMVEAGASRIGASAGKALLG